jgi:hypothetical protein
MKNNRRDFIKLAGMAGLGLTGAGIIPAYAGSEDKGQFFPGYNLEKTTFRSSTCQAMLLRNWKQCA